MKSAFLNLLSLAPTAAWLLPLALATVALANDRSRSDPRCYELRIYQVAPGKRDALIARFRDHTDRLFARHGIERLGYWVPVDATDHSLVFLLAYPSRAERETRWEAFRNDPEWQAARKESEAGGPLLTGSESILLSATDYSPAIAAAAKSPERVFELRTYKAQPGRLAALNARFRDRTVALFSKHGMTHLGYWMPLDAAKGSDDTLIYLLAHASQEAAAESFKAFRVDPDWIAAREASEKAAGGSLTVQPGGVRSQFLRPLPFSPTR
ncbi:MAG: NIPSNAP family protein [Verrucomicrobia bacterium]|nr:NIPSNAP family protein [Verrucomicrobiota bacterium]